MPPLQSPWWPLHLQQPTPRSAPALLPPCSMPTPIQTTHTYVQVTSTQAKRRKLEPNRYSQAILCASKCCCHLCGELVPNNCKIEIENELWHQMSTNDLHNCKRGPLETQIDPGRQWLGSGYWYVDSMDWLDWRMDPVPCCLAMLIPACVSPQTWGQFCYLSLF